MKLNPKIITAGLIIAIAAAAAVLDPRQAEIAGLNNEAPHPLRENSPENDSMTYATINDICRMEIIDGICFANPSAAEGWTTFCPRTSPRSWCAAATR
jgi:hypothetical protein